MATIPHRIESDVLVAGPWARSQLDSGAGIAQFGIIRLNGTPMLPIFLTSENRGALIIWDNPVSAGIPVPEATEENHGFSWWVHNISARTTTSGDLPEGNPPGIPILPLGAGTIVNGKENDPLRPPVVGVGELALITIEYPEHMNVYKVVANIRPIVTEHEITITPGTPIAVDHGLDTRNPDITVWRSDGALSQLGVSIQDEHTVLFDGGRADTYIIRIRP